MLKGGAKASTGDVVLVSSNTKWDCAHLKGSVQAGPHGTFCLVQFYKLQVYESETGFATGLKDDSLALVPVDQVLAPVTFSATEDGVLTLVLLHLK